MCDKVLELELTVRFTPSLMIGGELCTLTSFLHVMNGLQCVIQSLRSELGSSKSRTQFDTNQLERDSNSDPSTVVEESP